MKLCLLFLSLPCLAWAQYNAYVPDSVRVGKTVQFTAFNRIHDGTVLEILAQDEKGKIYVFSIPDQHRHLSESDIVSSVSWCVVVTTKFNVVGVVHIGKCTREEIGTPNSSFFLGTDEIKRSLTQQK